jgi:Ser/Thr protein kinase RdoA (MazF antagonist)
MLHYSAWIARRWEDPSFRLLFPNFGTEEWWREEYEALYETLESSAF